MKGVSFINKNSSVPTMQFNITTRETNNSTHNNTTLRNGNNSTASLIGSRLQNHDCNNDVSTIKDMMMEEKQNNDKFRKDMTNMNMMMMNFMQELRNENEELKHMIKNMMNPSTTLNGIASCSNVVSMDEDRNDVDDDSFESIEMDKALALTRTTFIPSIISSVNDKKNLLHNIL